MWDDDSEDLFVGLGLGSETAFERSVELRHVLKQGDWGQNDSLTVQAL